MEDNSPERLAEGNKSNGSTPNTEDTHTNSERVSLTDLVREYAPSGEPKPALPGFHPESGWEFRTVSRRCCPGRKGETQLCPATGEQFPVTEPHIHVTARRDEFADIPSQTAEFKHFVFPSPDELRQWFEEDQHE